jgi:hypothetical protein
VEASLPLGFWESLKLFISATLDALYPEVTTSEKLLVELREEGLKEILHERRHWGTFDLLGSNTFSRTCKT